MSEFPLRSSLLYQRLLLFTPLGSLSHLGNSAAETLLHLTLYSLTLFEAWAATFELQKLESATAGSCHTS